MPFPWLEAVAVGDVDVDDVRPCGPDAGRDVSLLDIHVEEIGHDPDPTSGPLGELDALLETVDEVLLVAVERFEKDRHSRVSGCGCQLFELLGEQLPLEVRRTPVRGQVG